jgi:hypothetical protein
VNSQHTGALEIGDAVASILSCHRTSDDYLTPFAIFSDFFLSGHRFSSLSGHINFYPALCFVKGSVSASPVHVTKSILYGVVCKKKKNLALWLIFGKKKMAMAGLKAILLQTQKLCKHRNVIAPK